MITKSTAATARHVRNKGKGFERELVKRLKNTGIDAKRVPMSGALAWLQGDVIEYNTINPHVHECKNQETLKLNEWWEQTISQVKDNEIPVLHFTANYKSPYTMITSELFDQLLFSYEKYRGELDVRVVDIASRKNFWKVVAGQKHKFTAYVYHGDRVIILLDVYLLFRRQDLRHQAETLVA